jgi:Ran GTPase-activating protein 1
MPQNGIRPEGIATIVKGLRKNPNLEHLDLQDNTFTQKGSRALAAALPSWPKLHTLNLSDCLLRPKGGRSVMTTLSGGSNPLLKSVKLQSNELDSPAIVVLAQAISQHLGSLVDLELNGNYGEEEDEGYEKVKEALAKWGHEDALDELDELEEQDEDEEEEEDEVESEEEIVEEAEEEEDKEPKVAPKDEDDDLASALAGIKIN